MTHRFIVTLDIPEPPLGVRLNSPEENREALKALIAGKCAEDVGVFVAFVPPSESLPVKGG